MNVWLIFAIVGAVVIGCLVALKLVHIVVGKRFDKDWEKMSLDERWKLQNEARKKNVSAVLFSWIGLCLKRA